jgi:hypothetical protein
MSHYQLDDKWSQLRSGVKPRYCDNAYGKKRGASWARAHKHRRDGDECACSCGKRWPYGEQHP